MMPPVKVVLPCLFNLACKGSLCDGLHDHIAAVYELNPNNSDNLTFGSIAKQKDFHRVVSHYAQAYTAPREQVLQRYEE